MNRIKIKNRKLPNKMNHKTINKILVYYFEIDSKHLTLNE